MRRLTKLVTIFALWLCVGAAFAQSTTVTGTVTDSDSIAWANGFITFTLIGQGQQYYCAGTLMTPNQTSVSSSLDGSGSFSVTLCPNASVTPVNSQWSIRISSATTAPPQTIAPVTISGSSQSLTSYIGGLIAPIRIPATSYRIVAYADGEIVSPTGGTTYYSLTATAIRLYNGAAWNSLTTGTAPVSSVFTRTGAVTAQSGDYTCAQVTNCSDKSTTQTIVGAWTFSGITTFSNAFSIAAGKNFTSSDGSATSLSIGLVSNGAATMDLNANNGNTAFSARSAALGGVFTSGGFGTSQPMFVRAGSNTLGMSDSATGDALVIAQSGGHIRLGVTGTNSTMQVSGTQVTIPGQKSTTGTRFLCIDTSGNITSSATACSGT